MGTGIIKEKFEKLPDDLKLKVEGYIDALLSEINTNSGTLNKQQEDHHEDFAIKPGFGGGKGIFGYMAEDFNEPLDEFKEYR
jgi:uncharacterized protein YjbJ (UPF0337 family)